MRLVSTDVVRIDLKDGPNGEKNWIEIKKEIGKGEEARFRAAGFGRMSRTTEVKAGEKPADAKDTPIASETIRNEVDVDWAKMAVARVETYLVEWSIRDKHDKPVPVTTGPNGTISKLPTEDFDEIDEAIQAHMTKMDEEKKAPSASPSSTLASV